MYTYSEGPVISMNYTLTLTCHSDTKRSQIKCSFQPNRPDRAAKLEDDTVAVAQAAARYRTTMVRSTLKVRVA
ncbi:hypothetical protein J6590_038489 [Homalodisca vitripennis]|nr:hypothetical protein J6590_038489 [Homalodisca vitripennis]